MSRDHLEQLPRHVGRERDVVAEQRPRRSENTRQRRAQLVRDGRDELALALVDAVLEREVAERVHDPFRAEYRDDRQPELPPVDVDRDGDRTRARAFDRDGDLRGYERPAGKDVRDRRAEHALAVETGYPLRGAVPETDDAAVVEQEDAVADRLEHLRCVLALGRDRTRSSLRFGELLAFHLGANACRGLGLGRFVQPRVSHRGAELADQPFDEMQVLLAVGLALAHHLHDADDPTLVLDRDHHRRLRRGRAGVGQLPDVPRAVDVVVRPGRVGNPLAHVVLEQRLSRPDHLRLHPAAVRPVRQRRQRCRIDVTPVHERVVATDHSLARVERRDDDAVAVDCLPEDLAKALVHALGVQRLAEIARCIQQQPRRLGIADELPPKHAYRSTLPRSSSGAQHVV